MNFEDAENATVSREEAAAEIETHQLDPAEFFNDVGDRAEYKGYEVLGWIGY